VQYARGVPVLWVPDPDGGPSKNTAPVDQTVISWKLVDQASVLAGIKLSAGMNRADVESAVAKATGVASSYGVYSGAAAREEADLQAVYQYGKTQLHIKYNHGTPAPWVRPAGGGPAVHYPPFDQSVKSWTLKKISK
jgi:hypothetical protein